MTEALLPDAPAWRRADIEALVPHRGSMCLLDRVIACDAATITCAAVGHRDASHPLKTGGRLLASATIEYAAQAAAVHGGLLARAAAASAPPGLLASARDVRLARLRLDDLPAADPDDLFVFAERQAGDTGRILYAFRVEHGGLEIASGRLAVLLQPQEST